MCLPDILKQEERTLDSFLGVSVDPRPRRIPCACDYIFRSISVFYEAAR